MPVDVPPGPQVAQETSTLLDGQPRPEGRRDRPHRADDLAPVPARGGVRGNVLPHEPRVPGDGARRAVEPRRHRVGTRGSGARPMLARQEAVPRHGEERKAHAPSGQVERDVHHSQPGPEHQDGFAGADHVERSPDPRVADVPVGLVDLRAHGRRVRGRVVAEGEHDAVGGDAGPGEHDLRRFPVGLRLDVARDGHEALEAGGPGKAMLGFPQQRLQVLAVQPPRDEGLVPDRLVAGPRPPDEVVPVVGQRAHAAGRNVQDVGLDRGSIGDPAAHRAEPVDEQDPRRTAPAQQLRDRRRAAEASADHGDGGGVAAHSRADNIRPTSHTERSPGRRTRAAWRPRRAPCIIAGSMTTRLDGSSQRERAEALQEHLAERILVLDGATGTWLQGAGPSAADFGGPELEGCNENLVLTRPDVIRRMHADYLAAGADMVETDTFGGTPLVLAEYGLAGPGDRAQPPRRRDRARGGGGSVRRRGGCASSRAPWARRRRR